MAQRSEQGKLVNIINLWYSPVHGFRDSQTYPNRFYEIQFFMHSLIFLSTQKSSEGISKRAKEGLAQRHLSVDGV